MGELELLDVVQYQPYSEQKEYSDHIFRFDGAAFAGGKRNGDSHDEQKGRENEVCKSEAVPLGMHQPPPASFHAFDVIGKHHTQDRESPIDIQRLQSFLLPLFSLHIPVAA